MADGGPFGEMVLGEHHAHLMYPLLQTRCQEKNGAADFATKFSARLLLNKSGFETVLMIKLDGLTNGKEVLRSSIF